MEKDMKLGLIVALLTLIAFFLMLLSYYYGMNTAVKIQEACSSVSNATVKFSFPYIYVSYPTIPVFNMNNTTETFK